MSDARKRNKTDSNGNDGETDAADKNMAATIASEEALAIPNQLLAEEIVEEIADVLSPVVEDLLGEGLVELLEELGADSAVELVVGECLNNITGGLSGTLLGLTFSAYRSGVYLAPTKRSALALIIGMIGGLLGSTCFRYLAVYVGEAYEALTEEDEYGAMICTTVLGALGAFLGRYNGIKISYKVYDTYFKKVKVK